MVFLNSLLDLFGHFNLCILANVNWVLSKAKLFKKKNHKISFDPHKLFTIYSNDAVCKDGFLNFIVTLSFVTIHVEFRLL